MKYVFIGMHRPAITDILGPTPANVWCPCRTITQSREETLYHWHEGHFDVPLYKDEHGNVTFKHESE